MQSSTIFSPPFHQSFYGALFVFVFFSSRTKAPQNSNVFPASPAVAAATSSTADSFADCVVSTLPRWQQLLAGLLVRLCKHAIKAARFTPFLRPIETGVCAAAATAAASLGQRRRGPSRPCGFRDDGWGKRENLLKARFPVRAVCLGRAYPSQGFSSTKPTSFCDTQAGMSESGCQVARFQRRKQSK